MRSRKLSSLLLALVLASTAATAHAADAHRPERAASAAHHRTEVIEASSFSFARTVLKSDVPVVVDFWAPWCIPCRALDAPLGKVADELGSRVRIVRVNVNWAPGLLHRYGVQSLPTLLVFKGGEVVSRTSGGGTTQQELEELVADALGIMPANGASGVQQAAATVGQTPTGEAQPVLRVAEAVTDGGAGGGALR
jgi:thioredoxin 1